MRSTLLKSAALLLPGALAQFVPAPTDLISKMGFAGVNVRYKEVPTGICELDPKVKSYSGYADVAPGQHIFFWFFEARNQDPTKAPLTVWINGGPGSSSMIGLMQENGPCGVDYNGNVYSNPYSWSNASNMIYIDQPTTVGFSYSDPVVPGYTVVTGPNTDTVQLPSNVCPDYAQNLGTCGTYSTENLTLTADSTPGAAPNFWKTIQGFMGAFPQYARNGFHFTTESYGGHYGTVFSEYFETQNAKNIPGATHVSLKSVAIGNGWYDPRIQYGAYYNFTVSPGNTYDFFPYNASTEAQLYNQMYGPGNCNDMEIYCEHVNPADEVCDYTDMWCANYVEEVLDNVANRDEYDIRELQPDPFPYGFFVDYLNTPEVQKAVGAYTNYSESSQTTYDAFTATGDDSRIDHTVQDMKKLLDQGVSVTMYTGDADYNCNWLGGQVISHMVGQPGFDKAGYTDLITSDHIVHGQVRQAGNFAFLRIYYSGHEVPFYQPLAALEMFERVIAGKDLATGSVTPGPSYRTNGPQTSDFREGISTVQFTVTPDTETYNTTTHAPSNSTVYDIGKRDGEIVRRNAWSSMPVRPGRPSRSAKRAAQKAYQKSMKARRAAKRAAKRSVEQ